MNETSKVPSGLFFNIFALYVVPNSGVKTLTLSPTVGFFSSIKSKFSLKKYLLVAIKYECPKYAVNIQIKSLIGFKRYLGTYLSTNKLHAFDNSMYCYNT